MREAIKNRIGITSSDVNLTSSSRLTIRAWRFQKESIINKLAIQASPEIGPLVAATNESDTSDQVIIPSDLAATLTHPVTPESNDMEDNKRLSNASIPWQMDGVAKLMPSHARKLTITPNQRSSGQNRMMMKIEWSDAGRDAFAKASSGDLSRRFGLKFGSVLEGIAVSEIDSVRGIEFHLSSQSSLSNESISAAIRGPALPSALELIEQ